MKNRMGEGGSEGDAANTLAVGRCTRGSAVQTSGNDTHIPPKLPAEKQEQHDSSVAGELTDRRVHVCFFFSKSCRSSAPWVRGPSSRLQSQRMVLELSGRAETLVVSAVQHTNMLVRLLKRSSHNKQTTEGENVFLMYNAGKRGAWQQVGEERRVKTSQAEFNLLIWRLSFNTQPPIALSSLNNINNKNEIWETSKENEAVYKKNNTTYVHIVKDMCVEK